MSKFAGVLAALLVPAFFAAGAVAGPAVQKIIVENDKVRVYEVTFKPGDEGANVARPYRVVRALKGGTIERNYPDGKKQKVEWKAGEVKQLGPDTPYVPKNVGKTVVVLYGVEIKQPK
jgi:hypothetical protein